MTPLLIIFLILLVVSGAGLIVFIMLHSGKGTGISDAIASSLYNSSNGTSIVEKNLDRTENENRVSSWRRSRTSNR